MFDRICGRLLRGEVTVFICDDEGWVPEGVFRQICEQHSGPLTDGDFAALRGLLCAHGVEVRPDGAVKYRVGWAQALVRCLEVA